MGSCNFSLRPLLHKKVIFCNNLDVTKDTTDKIFSIKISSLKMWKYLEGGGGGGYICCLDFFAVLIFLFLHKDLFEHVMLTSAVEKKKILGHWELACAARSCWEFSLCQDQNIGHLTSLWVPTKKHLKHAVHATYLIWFVLYSTFIKPVRHIHPMLIICPIRS